VAASPPYSSVNRSRIVAHGICDQLNTPFQKVHEAEEYISTHPFYSSTAVKPASRAAQEGFGRNFAGSGTGSSAEFQWLDVYSASSQHGNMHANPPCDCLHYAVNEVPLVWNEVLFGALPKSCSAEGGCCVMIRTVSAAACAGRGWRCAWRHTGVGGGEGRAHCSLALALAPQQCGSRLSRDCGPGPRAKKIKK
jgi:hypothetical protein